VQGLQQQQLLPLVPAGAAACGPRLLGQQPHCCQLRKHLLDLLLALQVLPAPPPQQVLVEHPGAAASPLVAVGLPLKKHLERFPAHTPPHCLRPQTLLAYLKQVQAQRSPAIKEGSRVQDAPAETRWRTSLHHDT
jgi:hypothetical protein